MGATALEPHGAPGPFAAWRHRDYRLLIGGQAIATLGGRLQAVALAYQVYGLHQSPLELGALGLVRLIPTLIFSLGGGVLADRVDRRRLLLLTEPALMCCARARALATYQGWATLWIIYAITGLSATIATVGEPTRDALLPALVPRAHLTNALSWAITISSVMAIVGPALGGLALGALGVAGTYAVEALGIAIAIGTLAAMRSRLGAAEASDTSGWHAAIEGLQFVRGNSIVLGVMALDFLANFWGSATVLLPVLADRVFHVGPTTLGFLYAAPAVGSVAGAAVMTGLSHRLRRPGWPLLGALALYGLATIGLGLARDLPLAFLALIGVGLADTIGMTCRSQILQLATPNALRGRVTAAEQLFTGGGPQAGQLEAGAVAKALGVSFAIVSGGLACIISVVLIAWLVPTIRRYDLSADSSALEGQLQPLDDD
jgi:MFS family permease